METVRIGVMYKSKISGQVCLEQAAGELNSKQMCQQGESYIPPRKLINTANALLDRNYKIQIQTF